MYGEAAAGKIYKPGVEVACTISADDFDYNTDEFGPDLRQNAVFSFLREQLIDAGLRPELGDIIDWIGWAILTWSISGLVFAIWTIANLFPRALAHHKWYQEKFSDYPKNRKAIIPGII